MTRFDECLAFVFGAEGGFSNDRFDRGGPTQYGITQATYNAYRTRHHLSVQSVAGITKDEARSIYFNDYWKAPCFAELPAPLDLVCFDAGVNCGPGNAARWLQSALGVTVDGQIGSHTLTAVNRDQESGILPSVVSACLDERRAHYDRICKTDPTQRRFYNGWMARVGRIQSQTEVV